MPRKRIDESAVVVAMTGVHDKSGLLVDNEYIIVFIYNINRDILRNDLTFITRPVHNNLNNVKRLDAVVTLNGLSVDKYTSGVCGLLDTVA